MRGNIRSLFIQLVISICIISTAKAEIEPNNSSSKASKLNLNASDGGALGIGDSLDYWRIKLLADGKLVINTTSDLALDLDLQLIDSDGETILATNDTSYGIHEATHYDNLRAGTYYVIAFKYSGSGNYAISSIFTEAAFAADPMDNDVSTSATELFAGAQSTGHIGFFGNNYTDDVDWWKITLNGPGRLLVSTTTDNNSNLDLLLYDSDQLTEIASYDSIFGIHESVEHKSLQAGTYYIKAYRRYGGFSPYTIKASFTQASHPNDPENNDQYTTAVQLPIGTTKEGNLGYYGNLKKDTIDWYKITIPEDGKLIVNSTSDASIDIDLYIFDQNGIAEIAKYTVGTGIYESVQFTHLKAGTYFIQTSDYKGYGGYEISANFEQAALPNDIENNDLLPNASLLLPNQQNSGHIGFFGNGIIDTTDYWKITIPSLGSLTITTVTDTNTNIDLLLYDVDQTTELASSDSIFGIYESAGYNNLSPGTYYVKVYRRYSGFSAYSILGSFVPQAGQGDQENNDTVEVAIPLPVNGSKEGVLGYYQNMTKDSTDWYKITIPADGYLAVKTTSDATIDVDLFLYDQDGTTEIARYDTGVGIYESVHYENLKAGTYFIQAFDYKGYGGYIISSVFNAADFANDTENNDLSNSASFLTPNSANSGHIGFFGAGFRDTTDWWQISLPVSGNLAINTVTDTNSNIDIILYDSDKTTELATSDSIFGIYESASKNGLRPGTYYAKIYRRYSGFSAYSIMADFIPTSSVDDPDNNDTPQSSTEIAINSSNKGTLGFYGNHNTDTLDWYKITLPEDGKLVVNTVSDQTIDIDLFIYDQDGSTRIARYDTGTGIYESVHYDNLKAGTYFILASDFSGYGGYSIETIYAEASFTNDTALNDSPIQAQLLFIDSALTGHIGYFGNGKTDEDDWYKFELTEPRTIELRVKSTMPTDILDLNIYQATNLIETYMHSGMSGDSEIVIKELPAGIYYIDLYKFKDFGSYSITLSLEPLPVDPEPIPGTYTNAYPNPTAGVLHLKNDTYTIQQVRISDSQGKLAFIGAYADNKADINISELGRGIFFVELTTSGGSEIKKVVVN